MTDNGKIEDIVKEYIQKQKDLEYEAEQELVNSYENLNNQLIKELELYEKGELIINLD